MRALTIAVTALVGLAGCGGGDDDAGDEAVASAAPVNRPSDPDADADADVGSTDTGRTDVDTGTDVASDDGAGSAPTATVTVAGVTYHFGFADGASTICTVAGGALQIWLPLLDESGESVDGLELTAILPEPGNERPGEFQVVTPDGVWAAGGGVLVGMLGVEAPPVDLVPNGSTANGTLAVIDPYDPATVLDAHLEAHCG